MTDKLQALLLRGQKHTYSKNQVIQSTDDNLTFSFIKSGYIKRYLIGNDGAIGVQVIYGPGFFFPVTKALELILAFKVYSGPETYYYETITDTVVYSINSEQFVEAVKKDESLFKDLLYATSRRLEFNINRIENMSLRTAYKRVAHLLVFYAREFGKKRLKGGIQIAVPLTQQDIADNLSLTRETVSISINHLKTKKLITGKRKIIVPNVTKLEAEAHS